MADYDKKAYELKREGKTRYEIAETLGISPRQARRGWERYESKLKKEELPKDNKYTVTINSDGTQTSEVLLEMSREQAKDEEFLLKAHGYDTELWEIVSARNNIWNVYSKKDGVQVLYSSKITVKPTKGKLTLKDIEEFCMELVKRKPMKPIPLREYKPSSQMLEIATFDVHLGKLAWYGETGESYDYKIARQRFLGVIQDFKDRVKGRTFEKVLFPFGQDFFNIDNTQGKTTAGTEQDCDLRWKKLFMKGVEIAIEAIDMLAELGPVKVLYVPGNHDNTTSYGAICCLYFKYAGNENVTVDISPKARKYEEFGKCLIGFGHGEKERKRIDKIMQEEAARAWGRTVYREWHLGHLHKESSGGYQMTEEYPGLIVRRIGAITGTDNWHYESGFVGVVKKAEAFIWDKEEGLKDKMFSNIVIK